MSWPLVGSFTETTSVAHSIKDNAPQLTSDSIALPAVLALLSRTTLAGLLGERRALLIMLASSTKEENEAVFAAASQSYSFKLFLFPRVSLPAWAPSPLLLLICQLTVRGRYSTCVLVGKANLNSADGVEILWMLMEAFRGEREPMRRRLGPTGM